jgi:hypothetical protein
MSQKRRKPWTPRSEKGTKGWSVTNVNTVLLEAYALLAVTFFAPFLWPDRTLYFYVPFGICFAAYVFFSIKLYRVKRPCGHMSVRRAGRFGQVTPFIRRECPMCGDELKDVSIRAVSP